MRAPLGVRVLGGAENPRQIVSRSKAVTLYAHADPSVQPELPAYLSAFAYPEAFRQHYDTTGSTAGYLGPVAVPDFNFDIDRPDLDVALRDARRLSQFVAYRYTVDPLVHYSGSKGFHVSLLTGGFIEPAPDNHTIAQALACRLAGEIGVEIDQGVYLKVQLWRAPNSRHHRTGRHKVRIDLDELLYLSPDQVRRIAADPVPYDPPMSSSVPARLVADWNAVAAEVRLDRPERRVRRHATNGEARTRINPLTRTLLTDPTSIRIGERHKTILSAAADLAEFRTVDDLITALLMSPGLDTGLPPREVARQISCGIAMARRQQHGEEESS
jgi:hypothetical protein